MSTTNFVGFVERLKELREYEKLSGAQMAKKIGVSQQSYNGIENGHTKPGFNFIVGAAKHFGAEKLFWLLTGELQTIKLQASDTQKFWGLYECSTEEVRKAVITLLLASQKESLKSRWQK